MDRLYKYAYNCVRVCVYVCMYGVRVEYTFQRVINYIIHVCMYIRYVWIAYVRMYINVSIYIHI